MSRFHNWVGSLTLFAAGCAVLPAPVPLTGERSAAAALAGEWNGEYRADRSGRTGSILFLIRSMGDSAFGEVAMDSPEQRWNRKPIDAPEVHALHARNPAYLSIRFVEIARRTVEGALEPYIAPDCGCQVETRFRGYITADTVAGTFMTSAPGLRDDTGTWRVVRARGP